MPNLRSISRKFLPLLLCAAFGLAPAAVTRAEVLHVGFLWHMHQPIYYRYIPLTQSDPFFTFSPVDVHNQRLGPYTAWPVNAIAAGQTLPHLGAQVSFSGSLIENLNALESSGASVWTGWSQSYANAQALSTALGNRRLDLVAFGYHHPLMPLLDEQDIRMQIRLHRHVCGDTWGSA